VDRLTHSLDEALGWAREAAAAGRAESIALVGNAAEIEPSWCGAASASTSSPTRPPPTTR
jgi:urocanate hydratase